MWQPRVGISWDPKGDGKTVVRLNGGLFYARIPGLNLASSRSTNGSRAQNAFRASFFNGFGVTPPTYPEPAARRGRPGHTGPPRHLRLRQGLREPADPLALRRSGARARARARRARPVQLREGRSHHALLRAERLGVRLPLGNGARGRRDERHRLRHHRGQRDGECRGHGQEPVRRHHDRPEQAPVRTTTSSRSTTRCRGTSPTTTRSATRSRTGTSGTTTSPPSTATPTATSAIASTRSCSGWRRARSTSTCATRTARRSRSR